MCSVRHPLHPFVVLRRNSLYLSKELHIIMGIHFVLARRPRLNILFLLVCIASLLAACGGNTSNATSTSTQSAASCDKQTGFTLYSAIGYDSDAAKAFQQQTGIHVKLVDDSTGNLLAKISAERNNPQWDVVWFDGNVTMQTLDDQGYLLKWNSPNINNYTTLAGSDQTRV
jgi:iron(III) transport system substrate-binding protein